ncbi:MAG: FlgD immunoglobulin-like domain containing protein, partial [Candidatus Latescibacterota bacterium]
ARVFLDAADSTDLGILAAGRLWRSSDAGSNWAVLNEMPGAPSATLYDVAVDAGARGALYVGTGAGVYRLQGRPPTTWVAQVVLPVRPRQAHLAPPYPNPFNGSTVIRYSLCEPARVEVAVYDLLGQRVATLVERAQAAGHHSVTWDGRDDQGRPLASGVHVCRLVAGRECAARRMVLSR